MGGSRLLPLAVAQSAIARDAFPVCWQSWIMATPTWSQVVTHRRTDGTERRHQKQSASTNSSKVGHSCGVPMRSRDRVERGCKMPLVEPSCAGDRSLGVVTRARYPGAHGSYAARDCGSSMGRVSHRDPRTHRHFAGPCAGLTAGSQTPFHLTNKLYDFPLAGLFRIAAFLLAGFRRRGSTVTFVLIPGRLPRRGSSDRFKSNR